MKLFKINDLLNYDFFFVRYQDNCWGKQQHDLILMNSKFHRIVIINYKLTFYYLKKIYLIITEMALKNCIMLSIIKDFDSIDQNFCIEVQNCYYTILSKCFNFINSFKFYYDNIAKNWIKDKTNYGKGRLPSLVLMTKDSWKKFDTYFFIFLKLKILFIKCGSFLQKDINLCYNLMLENSNKIYFLGLIIYKLRNLIKKKW